MAKPVTLSVGQRVAFADSGGRRIAGFITEIDETCATVYSGLWRRLFRVPVGLVDDNPLRSGT